MLTKLKCWQKEQTLNLNFAKCGKMSMTLINSQKIMFLFSLNALLYIDGPKSMLSVPIGVFATVKDK